MLKIGIIGGIGPEATLYYYKNIINIYRAKTGDTNYPQIIINSINMTEMFSYIEDKNFTALIGLLLSSINELKNAGADFAVMASNTPHMVFDQVNEKSALPLISIVEKTCRKASSLNLKKVLLLGTSSTMKADFYQNIFTKNNIKVITPGLKDQDIIHNIIFPELEEGIVVPEKKEQLINICNNIIDKESIEGLILGCTEFPLMIKDDDFDIAVLNTSMIHIDAVVSKLIT